MTPLTLLGRPVRTPYDRIGYVVRVAGGYAILTVCIDEPPDQPAWIMAMSLPVAQVEPIDRGMAFGGAN